MCLRSSWRKTSRLRCNAMVLGRWAYLHFFFNRFVFFRSARERTRFCGWFQHQGKWLVMRKPALVMWSCFKAVHMWLSLHKQHNPTCDYQTRTSRRCAQALLSLAAAPWTREFASLLLLVATWRRLGSFWLCYRLIISELPELQCRITIVIRLFFRRHNIFLKKDTQTF